MLCPNCKQELSEGSRFCGNCGTPVAQNSVPEIQTPPTAEVPLERVIPPLDQESELVQPKKPKKKVLFAGVAVVAVVLVVVLVANLFFGSSQAYVYMSGGNYMLLTDVDGDTVKIASAKSDSDFDGMLSFSTDGKYLYYFTKFDMYDYCGTLCRAEFGKLKSSSNKNSKYIEVIDTDVYAGIDHCEDGVLYRNSDDELYYYDGGESIRICEDVSNYVLSEDQSKLLFETGNSDEGYTLYAMELSKPNETREIASGYEYAYNLGSFDSIVIKSETETEEVWNEEYGSYEYTESNVLSTVNFAGEIKELAADASIVLQNDGAVYYVIENGTALNLYDYVSDSTAAADAAAVEPNIDNYQIPVYDYSMVSDYSKTEADYGELYTSCTEGLHWLGSGWWSYYSMEDAVSMEWGDNTAAFTAAMQRFIDKYKSAEDEDGMIPVTDEIKTELKAITAAYYGAEDAGQWISLCYEKYQSDTDYDYDAYYTDLDVYQQTANRNAIRQALKDPENARQLLSVYRVKDGTAEMICDNVVKYETVINGIFYSTPDMLTETMALEGMEWYGDIYDVFGMTGDAYLYMITTGKSCRMSADAAEAYDRAFEDGYPGVYVYGSDVFLLEDDNTLSVASASGGEVGDFAIITDNGEIMNNTDDGVYYMSELYESGGDYYGDIYCYSEGETVLKARDVLTGEAYVYEDGRILAYTGGDSYSGFELTMFETDGSSWLVAEGVTQFVRQDSDIILYISDTELYCMDKDERTRLDDGVSHIWVKDAMKIEAYLYSGYYGGY